VVQSKVFQALNSYDRESFSNKRQGHDEVGHLLEAIFTSKYNLKLYDFNPKGAR
jgi:hypothetical protein